MNRMSKEEYDDWAYETEDLAMDVYWSEVKRTKEDLGEDIGSWAETVANSQSRSYAGAHSDHVAAVRTVIENMLERDAASDE